MADLMEATRIRLATSLAEDAEHWLEERGHAKHLMDGITFEDVTRVALAALPATQGEEK